MISVVSPEVSYLFVFTTLYTVVCLALPSLANGMITYSDETRGLDSLASHTCDPGYGLMGGNTRTCQNDGMWTGTAPTCER